MPKKSLLQFTEKRNHTNRIFYQRNLLIYLSFFASYGSMPWIIWHLWGFLRTRDAGCRDNKITGCTCIMGDIIDWKTVCIFAYSSTCEQSNKKSGVRLKNVGLRASRVWDSYAMLNDFEKKIWLLCRFFGGPSFRPEYEIVQSCNHAYLTLLFLGVMLWATSWTVSLSQDVLRLMVLFAASFVVIGLIKRLDQSISPDFI